MLLRCHVIVLNMHLTSYILPLVPFPEDNHSWICKNLLLPLCWGLWSLAWPFPMSQVSQKVPLCQSVRPCHQVFSLVRLASKGIWKHHRIWCPHLGTAELHPTSSKFILRYTLLAKRFMVGFRLHQCPIVSVQFCCIPHSPLSILSHSISVSVVANQTMGLNMYKGILMQARRHLCTSNETIQGESITQSTHSDMINVLTYLSLCLLSVVICLIVLRCFHHWDLALASQCHSGLVPELNLGPINHYQKFLEINWNFPLLLVCDEYASHVVNHPFLVMCQFSVGVELIGKFHIIPNSGKPAGESLLTTKDCLGLEQVWSTIVL